MTADTIDILNDPMGRAIAEYHQCGRADRLRVFSPLFDEDELPVSTLFRHYAAMPALERRALDLAQGCVLDVGAGAGCHSLVQQDRGLDVTAVDISPLAVETMRKRGVANAFEKDFYKMSSQYDTILMLMNGLGIVGTLQRMHCFFEHLDRILSPGGQLLCDSSDIRYVFDNGDGSIDLPNGDRYYGEMTYRMQYRDTVGSTFEWLYVDAETLKVKAAESGFSAEIVEWGDHYDYLARITRK